MSLTIESLLASLRQADNEPVYLISGNPVLAEPAAARLAQALAERGGAEVEVARRPARLGDLLGDLRTFSLFAGCRVLLVVESAVLADHRAAAELVDEVARSLPLSIGDELAQSERGPAGRLLQALRLFEIDAYDGSPEQAIGRLPAWALEGGAGRRRKRAKPQVEELRARLVALLGKARAEGLRGSADSDLAELGEILDNGLPPGHALVMSESSVSGEHPLVARLGRRGAHLELEQLESSRQGRWQGLEAMAAALEAETGVGIDGDALSELALRTLKKGEKKGGKRKGEEGRAELDSSERFAGEYRKLASLVGEGRIGAAMVHESVQDLGQEDVWKILDAIGEGDAAEALHRIGRQLAAAADESSARFALFGLLAGFCRQLTAVDGAMRATGVSPGERNYNRFKSRLAPRLQGDLDAGVNPLKGLHPFRLHRAYLAASRIPGERLARLPWKVLETELRMKGESRDADAALALLVTELATA